MSVTREPAESLPRDRFLAPRAKPTRAEASTRSHDPQHTHTLRNSHCVQQYTVNKKVSYRKQIARRRMWLNQQKFPSHLV